jgi:hypothetical protein
VHHIANYGENLEKSGGLVWFYESYGILLAKPYLEE